MLKQYSRQLSAECAMVCYWKLFTPPGVEPPKRSPQERRSAGLPTAHLDTFGIQLSDKHVLKLAHVFTQKSLLKP